MKSLEVWRKGYKADFSPGLGRSKCKVSPLPCLSWDSMGSVGQGRFRILHKSGIVSPGAWHSPGLAVWPGMLGRLAALLERLGGGFIGCRCWAALSCCDFLRAPSLLPSLPLQIVGSLGAGGGAGSGAGLGAGSAWVQAFPVPWAGWDAGASCWPCVLSGSAWCWPCLASSGAGSPLVPAGLCWALTAWGLLGAGSGSAWASLAPGSPPGCRAGRVSRPCRWW